MTLQIIILAAGQGKRMHSSLPKILHPLAGKPLLHHVIDTARALNPSKILVIYNPADNRARDALGDCAVEWVPQTQACGTGHAAMQALPYLKNASLVLILSADVPLIQLKTLKQLIAQQNEKHAALCLLLATVDNPFGLGRVMRNDAGEIQAIVEERDATATQKSIQEIYTGVSIVCAEALSRWLPQLNNLNDQQEYYLTDIIAQAVAEGSTITSVQTNSVFDLQGVNNRQQLHTLERYWQKHLALELLSKGVSIADINRIDIRGQLNCAQDVYIDVNSVFSGNVNLAEGCHIGPNCFLKDVTLGPNTAVLANSVLEDCEVDANCTIGPFARLRPGTALASDCRIGNFVEVKNAKIAKGSKVNHLSYIGDAVIGDGVNVGAGTITCNYDGVHKHQTRIETGAFIGSGTELVAPVTVGAHAIIGAGSTIRQDAPADELTLSEKKQRTIIGWKKRRKVT
ncbi:MAG: bifunctional UDP-N-acetylglucosamine diphosphorylase/glucosamine-1-phosphate N-acetyltransferase GlmU [Legionella sp.]|nr:bifunctional UDP-N-acetylglucosamine diphosphorylase/glucosamine-1-phosphate N-acetyltransferase GlmU [Legionella sp.]